jgi:hypothetical protein
LPGTTSTSPLLRWTRAPWTSGAQPLAPCHGWPSWPSTSSGHPRQPQTSSACSARRAGRSRSGGHASRLSERPHLFSATLTRSGVIAVGGIPQAPASSSLIIGLGNEPLMSFESATAQHLGSQQAGGQAPGQPASRQADVASRASPPANPVLGLISPRPLLSSASCPSPKHPVLPSTASRGTLSGPPSEPPPGLLLRLGPLLGRLRSPGFACRFSRWRPVALVRPSGARGS